VADEKYSERLVKTKQHKMKCLATYQKAVKMSNVSSENARYLANHKKQTFGAISTLAKGVYDN